jgi:hypothetical protein
MRKIPKSELTICVPIYKPDKSFIHLVKQLIENSSCIKQLIIYETFDPTCKKDSGLVFEKSKFTDIDFIYSRIEKKNFHHAYTRNLMVKDVKSKYVLFVTQDILIGYLDLDRILDQCDTFDLDSLCIRHTPHKQAFRRSWEYMFANLVKNLQDSKKISWWSNNFAIYRTESLLQIPFPPFGFAEDYNWARIASGMGMKLKYSTRDFIIHQNQDSLQEAYRRGQLEASESFKSAKYFGETRNKISILGWIAHSFVGVIRTDLKIETKIRLMLEAKRYLAFLSQNIGRIQEWNKLIKGKNEKVDVTN